MELPEETVAIGDYDFSSIHEYSDLETTQVELSSRITRRLSRNAEFWVGAAWYDLQDDAPWTYGDMTGSVLVTSTGLTTAF